MLLLSNAMETRHGQFCNIQPRREWIDAAQGSFVLAPGGATHDFENRSGACAGVLNFSVPGDFEQHMPGIAEWFAEHPPGRAEG